MCTKIARLQISYFIAAGIASAMWRDGFGQHIQYIIYRNPQGLVQIAKIIIPVQIAITLGPAFAKISACIFILRMIKNARRAISWSIYVLIFILTVVALATCVTWLVQCIPLARFWDTSVQGTCIDRIVFVRVFQSYNGKRSSVDQAFDEDLRGSREVQCLES